MTLWHDVRFGTRLLAKDRWFTFIAVLTLALGIGGNTTVFSVVQGLLLRPLPVTDPARLFQIEAVNRNAHSFPDYIDLSTRARTFSGIAAYRIAAMGIRSGDRAERAWGLLATGNYFEVLGVKPVIGRFFTPLEDIEPGASPYAVLSYDTWQRKFGGKANIVDTTVRINGLPYTILGVAPRGFHGAEVFYRPALWVPITMQPQIEGRSWLENRNTLNSWIVGRLRPGVSTEQATDDLNIIAKSIAAQYPRSHEGLQIALAQPGWVGSTGRAPISAFMSGVMGLALLVLLATCANLATLLGSRIVGRSREVAIRLSLGATRFRIVRQLLVETLLLCVLGGAGGLAISIGILRALSQWQLPLPLPVELEVMPDPLVFVFASATTLVVALLAALAPARRALRTDSVRVVAAGSINQPKRRWKLQDGLLAVQVALCCVLVTASVVSVKSLANALKAPVGFETTGISVVGFDLALAGYSPEEGRRFQRRALETVATLPGVTAVAQANSLPLTIDQSHYDVFPAEGDIRASRSVLTTTYQVSPGYLALMHTPLVAGRDFTSYDDVNAPRVAIVNETFVRRVMRTDHPIGSVFRIGRTQTLQVIGVVADGKYEFLSEDARPAMFLPAAQDYNSTAMIVTRSTLPEAEAARQIGRTIAKLDPRVPLLEEKAVSDAIALAFLPARAAGLALTAFGILAVVIAVAGVYGLAAYSVIARIREIGIRLAIGALPRQILRHVLGRTIALLAVGSLAGMSISVAGSQALGAIVFHASPRDPLVLIAVVVLMAMVGLCAAWMPARRALAVDPAQTLRDA